MVVLALREEIILSALWMLGGSSHGSLLRDKVVELSNKDVVYGTLYNLLEVLHRKGLITTRKDKPTPERGGKSKTIYAITEEGKEALQETMDLHRKIWKVLPEFKTGI